MECAEWKTRDGEQREPRQEIHGATLKRPRTSRRKRSK